MTCFIKTETRKFDSLIGRLRITGFFLFCLWANLTAAKTALELKSLRESLCNETGFQTFDAQSAVAIGASAGYYNTQTDTDARFYYFMKGGSGTFAALNRGLFGCMITFTVLSVLTAVLFLFTFLKNSKYSYKKPLFWAFVSFAVLAIFAALALVIAQLCFAAEVEKSHKRVKCQVVRTGDMLVNGGTNSATGNAYFGLETYRRTATWLSSEYVNFGNVAADAQAVVLVNLPQGVAGVLKALQSVAQQYKQMSSSDVFGKQSQGFSLRSLTDYVSDSVKLEITQFAQRCQAFNDMAASIMRLADPLLSTIPYNVNATMSFLSASIVSLMADITDFTLGSYEKISKANDRIRAGYWTFFCLAVIILVLYIRVAISVVSGLRVLDLIDLHSRLLTKMKLCFAVLLVSGLGAMTILTASGKTAAEGLCAGLRSVRHTQYDFIQQYRSEMPGMSRFALNECLLGNGRLTDLLGMYKGADQAPYLGDFWNVIGGVIEYSATATLGQTLGSRALEALTANYSRIISGEIADTTSVSLSLGYLREYLTPLGWTVCLTNQTCPDGQSPKRLVIDSTSVFPVSPNATANYQSARNLFANLGAYIVSEQAILKSLTDTLMSPTAVPTSPNQQLINTQSNLFQLWPQIVNIITNMTQTVAAVGNAPTSAAAFQDCRNVKNEFALLEYEICENLLSSTSTLLSLMISCFAVLGFCGVCLFIPFAFYGRTMRSSMMVVPAPEKVPVLDGETADQALNNPVH